MMKFAKDLYWYSKNRPFSQILGMGLSCNVFLINQEDELWMIDAGSGSLGRVRHLLRYIRQDHLVDKPLTKLLLTHTHPDHAAAIPKLRKKYPNLEIYAHLDDHPTLLKGEDQFWQDELDAAGPMFHRLYPFPLGLVKMMARYFFGKFPQIQAVHPLDDGEIIRGTKYNVRVIHTPGHTPGHCALLIPSQGVLFTGDLIETFAGNTPSMNLAVSDYAEYLQSVESLQNLDISYLCTAHGLKIHESAVQNKKRVLQCIQYMAAGEQSILKALREKHPDPVTLGYISRFAFRDKFPNRRRFMIHGILKYLQKQGKIRNTRNKFVLIKPM